MPLNEHLRRVEIRKAALRDALESCLHGVERVVLELGCGHGHWLTDYAAERADAFCLGIDVIGDRIDRATRKAQRAGLANARFLKAEASELLEMLPEGVTFESVFVLFPDPWPKKRHWKNRLFNASFLGALAKRCASGSRLYFRTDHDGYFAWAEEAAETLADWKVAKDGDWPFERETVFQSKADSFQSLILERV